MKKKVLAAVLACGLIASSFSFSTGVTASTSVTAEESDVVETGRTVTFMVTVNSPAMIDYVISSGGAYGDVGELLNSAEGGSCLQQIKASQEKVKNLVTSEIKNTDMSGSRSFTTITNGFTVKADVAYFNKLKGLDGVANVTISDKHEISKLDKEIDGEAMGLTGSYGMSSKSTINTQEAYDGGYTGKGTLIAILDSEFDVGHEVFSVKPEGQKYDKDYVRGVYNTLGLNISEFDSIDDVFYNDKILYAYDYGDGDTDCREPDFYHGTHVACIAAGNNGEGKDFEYKGMAYDAQLALLKISSGDGGIYDDTMVAALDDALKLSPDVINCSYGFTMFLLSESKGKQLYEKLMEAGVSVVASAGNESFNGSELGMKDIDATRVNYSTIAQPSGLKNAFSVASVEPDSIFDNEAFFYFNSERKVAFNMVPLDINIFEASTMSAEQPSAATKSFSGEVPEDEEYLYDEEIEYTYIDSAGEDIDFSKLDMTGRVIIFNQGSAPLEDVVIAAYDTNCENVIVVKNDEYFRPHAFNNAMVSVFMVESSEKEYLKEHPEGAVALRVTADMRAQENPGARMMDEYTSYGTLADLTLKPDIAAPGGNIFSAGYDNSYYNMSGTSMSSPCTAGAVAIMKQYLRQEGYSEHLSPFNEEDYVYKLMMSSADLAAYPYDVYGDGDIIFYSPRLQGAGIINLGSAIKTGGYLSVDGGRPKVSMRENLDGTYKFDFTITNRSETELTYYLDSFLFTDGCSLKTYADGTSSYINTLTPENIKKYATITYSAEGKETDSVTVSAGSDMVVSVSISLDAGYVKDHKEIFKNGFFVDGFVVLNSLNDVNLSLPFSGFCGNWADEPIFSNDIYSSTGYSIFDQGYLSLLALSNEGYYYTLVAGENVFGFDDLPGEIAFSKDSIRDYYGFSRYSPVEVSNTVLFPVNYLYREALDYTVSLKKGDELICSQNFGNMSNFYSSNMGPMYGLFVDSKEPLVYDYANSVEDLEEGDYQFVMSAATVGTDGNPGRTESRSYDVRVDNTNPVIKQVHMERTDSGKRIMHVVAYDNDFIQGIGLYALSNGEDGEPTGFYDLYEFINMYYESVFDVVTYSYDESTGLYYFDIDVSDYEKFVDDVLGEGESVVYEGEDIVVTTEVVGVEEIDKSVISIEGVDYAFNTTGLRNIKLNNYGEAKLKFVDESGAPVNDIKTNLYGEMYSSDSDGVMTIYNLPLSKIDMTIDGGSYVLASGDSSYSFELTEDKYKYEAVITVKDTAKKPSETSETSKKPEESKPEESKSEVSVIPEKHPHDDGGKKPISTPVQLMEESKVKTEVVTVKEQSQVSAYSTGDSGSGTVIPVVIMVIGSTLLVLTFGRKRKHE